MLFILYNYNRIHKINNLKNNRLMKTKLKIFYVFKIFGNIMWIFIKSQNILFFLFKRKFQNSINKLCKNEKTNSLKSKSNLFSKNKPKKQTNSECGKNHPTYKLQVTTN